MATLNIRINDAVKAEAQSVLDEIGLSMSNAISIYLTRIAKLRAIPFRLSADSAELEPTAELVPTDYLSACVAEAKEELKSNRNPVLIGKDELKDYLRGLRK